MAEKFANLDPNNAPAVNKLFVQAFHNILTNPQMGVIGKAAKGTSLQQRYILLKQYVEGKGGTLRLTSDGTSVEYKPEAVKNAAIQSPFAGGGTQGKTQMGGI